mmetsp:Transcript_12013/g.25247  ORF Transcript_12013/g.25247 Transcript_12013/m.25247 type:complete len:227 (+) Transcript_12013:2042-2722(+)
MAFPPAPALHWHWLPTIAAFADLQRQAFPLVLPSPSVVLPWGAFGVQDTHIWFPVKFLYSPSGHSAHSVGRRPPAPALHWHVPLSISVFAAVHAHAAADVAPSLAVEAPAVQLVHTVASPMALLYVPKGQGAHTPSSRKCPEAHTHFSAFGSVLSATRWSAALHTSHRAWSCTSALVFTWPSGHELRVYSLAPLVHTAPAVRDVNAAPPAQMAPAGQVLHASPSRP